VERKFVILFAPNNGAAKELAKKACEHLNSCGISILLQPEALDPEAEIVIAIGGDGSILYANRIMPKDYIPILGVNSGYLGYLTETEPAHLIESLNRLVAGEYKIRERSLLKVKTDIDGKIYYALNDGVLQRSVPGTPVRLKAFINSSEFITYSCDGIVISTSTGSTAYNFSLRGPVVSPDLDIIILNPISAHVLFDRPLLFDASKKISFEVVGQRHASLVVDGHMYSELKGCQRVEFSLADRRAKFVSLNYHESFETVLKTRFHLE
jgi:NAD+ kinase